MPKAKGWKWKQERDKRIAAGGFEGLGKRKKLLTTATAAPSITRLQNDTHKKKK